MIGDPEITPPEPDYPVPQPEPPFPTPPDYPVPKPGDLPDYPVPEPEEPPPGPDEPWLQTMPWRCGLQKKLPPQAQGKRGKEIVGKTSSFFLRCVCGVSVA